LTPAANLATGFALRHSSLSHLLRIWLVKGSRRRLRAAIRIVRLPAMKVALRGSRAPWPRLRAQAARLRTFLKLLAFQAARLVVAPLRHRREAAHRRRPLSSR
jgi:hypothetical protein